MKRKLALIKWIDSRGAGFEWEYLIDLEPLKPIICLSVGFIVEETNTYKTIAPTISGGQVWGRTTIPTCSIIDFKILNQ